MSVATGESKAKSTTKRYNDWILDDPTITMDSSVVLMGDIEEDSPDPGPGEVIRYYG